MARYHGINTNTYKKLAIDQCAVYRNYGEGGELKLGASRGGSTFTIEQDFRTMEVDGAKGPVKGDTRITAVRAILAVNFVELSKEVYNMVLPGSTIADYPTTPGKTHDEITRALQIALTDYIDNIVAVGQISGSDQPVICGIQNVLAKDNFEQSFQPNDEGVIAVKFTAHFTPEDLDSEPWFIRYPEIT